MIHNINSTYWTCLIADSASTRSSIAREWVRCYCPSGTWTAYKTCSIEDTEISLELQRLISQDLISDKTVLYPHNTKLVDMPTVNLFDSNIQDTGLKLVAEWIVESQVQELNLESNFITDHGVKALYNALNKISRNIHVNLNHNLITVDGANLLQKVDHATFSLVGNCISPTIYLPDSYFMNQDMHKLPQVLNSCMMAYEINKIEAPLYIDQVYGPGTFKSFKKAYS